MIVDTRSAEFVLSGLGAEPGGSVTTSPTGETYVDMTGEEFAWHVRDCMVLLLKLRATLVDWIARYPFGDLDDREICALLGVTRPDGASCVVGGTLPPGITLGADEMNAALARIDRQIELTGIAWGDDWEVIFVNHRNVLALAYRMDKKMDLAVAKSWYEATAAVLEYGRSVIETDVNWRAAIIASRKGFWDFVGDVVGWTIEQLKHVLELMAAWSASLLEGIGRAAGTIGGGIVAGIWEALKPLILPTLLLGGAAIGGIYLWRRYSPGLLHPEVRQLPAGPPDRAAVRFERARRRAARPLLPARAGVGEGWR